MMESLILWIPFIWHMHVNFRMRLKKELVKHKRLLQVSDSEFISLKKDFIVHIFL